MKRVAIAWSLVVGCALLAALFSFGLPGGGQVLVTRDALDPMADVLSPVAGERLLRFDPYQLAQQLPGLTGMAVAFGTQARAFGEASSIRYLPLYSATLVIAVNLRGNAAGQVRGWRTLLESGATVLLPHNATEGGRLAAIAMAQGLGARAGDYTPALEAMASLNAQGRLNTQDAYWNPGYLYVYSPESLSVYDAVVLWDYQFRALSGMDAGWSLCIPEEGAIVVDCGLVYGPEADRQADLRRAKAFLLSAAGGEALARAGFSPLSGMPDLSAWDTARLTYNPRFRREVLSVKRHATASVLERMCLQCGIMLLYCLAVWRILHRVPRGRYRALSLCALMTVLLWMLLGLSKTLSLDADVARYLWFATYVPRHFLPVLWFLMCYADRFERLPSGRVRAALFGMAAILTLFVLTNDLHRQVFAYTKENRIHWTVWYDNAWGYFVSLLWSFALSAAGIALFVSTKRTRRQRRRMAYAAAFFCLLAGYQAAYAAGVRMVIDLDIPTTVGICVALFIFAAQRERFLGASLLAMPIFRNALLAIQLSDDAGRTLYRNEAMEALTRVEIPLPDGLAPGAHGPPVEAADRVYQPLTYDLAPHRALVLEDITDLKRLERSLEQTRRKLCAVGELLAQRAERTRAQTAEAERERYARQMDRLFREKLGKLRARLARVPKDGPAAVDALRAARLSVAVCQQRLRLILRELEREPFPMAWIGAYARGLAQSGQSLGLDGVATSDAQGACPPGLAVPLLETLDALWFFLLERPGASLICRLEADGAGLCLNALIERDAPPGTDAGIVPETGISEEVIPESLRARLVGLGARVRQDSEADGLVFRLAFRYEEAIA